MSDFKKEAEKLVYESVDPRTDLTPAKQLLISQWAVRLETALREAYEKGLEDAAEISLDYCIDLDCPNYHDDEILLKSHLQGVTMKIMKLKRPVGGEK